MLKHVKCNADLKGLDVDFLVREHILVNKAPDLKELMVR